MESIILGTEQELYVEQCSKCLGIFFDPNELEESFNRTLNRKPLFAALNQLKFWQLYTEAYRIMTQPGSGLFPHHFGEDFVRSYEKQISEYKRAGRGYDGVSDRRKPKPAAKPGNDP